MLFNICKSLKWNGMIISGIKQVQIRRHPHQSKFTIQHTYADGIIIKPAWETGKGPMIIMGVKPRKSTGKWISSNTKNCKTRKGPIEDRLIIWSCMRKATLVYIDRHCNAKIWQTSQDKKYWQNKSDIYFPHVVQIFILSSICKQNGMKLYDWFRSQNTNLYRYTIVLLKITSFTI